MKHITKFAPIIIISPQINELGKILTGAVSQKVIGSFEKRAPGVTSMYRATPQSFYPVRCDRVSTGRLLKVINNNKKLNCQLKE